MKQKELNWCNLLHNSYQNKSWYKCVINFFLYLFIDCVFQYMKSLK